MRVSQIANHVRQQVRVAQRHHIGQLGTMRQQ